MKTKKESLLFLTAAGAEITWLYAWATFIVYSTMHRPFPLPEAIATFILAALLTIVMRGRGLRIIMFLALQVIGFLLSASRFIHVLFYNSEPFFNKCWLLSYLSRPKDPMEWFILVVILFFVLLFWIGGVTLARRSNGYLTVCTRFDVGIAAFFLLLIIKLLLLVKGGIDIQDSTPEKLLFPFFLFSLLAIGIARNQSGAHKDFLSGYRGIGVIVSFALVIFAFGAALVLLFLPYLNAAAEIGYDVLKVAAAPLGSILESVVRFFFIHNRSRPETVSSSSPSEQGDFVSSPEESWWSEIFEKIFTWGFVGMGIVIALILCAFGLWYLFRWLLSRTNLNEKNQIQWRLFIIWFSKMFAALPLVWGKIVRWVSGYTSSLQLYNALLSWGRHSGLPHFLNETPAEYGLRLKHQFPALTRDIGAIVETFNREVYGDIAPDKNQFKIATLAWKRLRNPVYWPPRFKSWLFKPGK
jgi:hypothetical protein